jgi:hypothetical protein
MDSSIVEDQKTALDSALDGLPADVGIAFGLALYAEFAERGWLTMEDFGSRGTGLFKGKLPAYARTHFAFPSLDAPETDFQIGSREVAGKP